MKRVVEKVKDIVEVRPFTHLHDFNADPLLTLGGYHFTDITADLMAKWIDRIARVRPGHGAALALAGFRGVGKSHFLAVVGSIVSRPELRGRISDSYVAASAEHLPRKHGSVAFIRRGLGTSLVDELKRAVSELLHVNPNTLSDSLYDLLLRASDHAGDSPLVVLIDTAPGRESRVARDDGHLISEIAEAADTLGIFVGVALDDDISGADGPNSSISTHFTINYLDQEHLYKIVDSHIFTKNSNQLQLLRDIYEDYRRLMPGFKWSEQRFTSLYPLHPATVEIAPLIRLYIQEFALLGFASEAGVKILGRPANSLIGLDEVFDSVEKRLRASSELKEAFEAFDQVEQKVIARLPVQQRLQAKLVLKGLLVLSLDGQGTTAEEIAASMMIFDAEHSSLPSIDVRALLESFVEALPGAIGRTAQDGKSAKYSLRLSTRETVDSKLIQASAEVGQDSVWQTLLRQVVDKFSDLDASTFDLGQATLCGVEWRGAVRRGEVLWSEHGVQERPQGVDWTIMLIGTIDQTPGPGDHIIWKVAELEPDELDTVRRHYLLQNDTQIRESLGDGLVNALHVHSISVEKIWQRAFIRDARVYADGVEVQFSPDATSSHSLAQLLTPLLEPIFENRFPEHPNFKALLGAKVAAAAVADFFSKTRPGNPDVQKIAETFLVPMGLAIKQGEEYVASAADLLYALPVVKAAFEGVGDIDNGVVSLDALAERMGSRPFGLTREAQHLVLASLVGEREFEFVTKSGNRINYRSLDLQIIWDDIVGVAKPFNEAFAPARLLAWAKLVTGNSGIKSLDREEDRRLVIDSLSGWLTAWKDSRILADFESLPDEGLNAQIWKTAASLRKSFGSMAVAINSLVNDEISLDQCLHTIAENFSDAEEEFERKKSELRILGDFTNSVSLRSTIASYLSLCEVTSDAEIELARNELLAEIDATTFWSKMSDLDSVERNWKRFHQAYRDYYLERHELAMSSGQSDELREILRSNDWSAFESLSRISWIDPSFLSTARTLIREIRGLQCKSRTKEILSERPYCGCGFSLSSNVGKNMTAELRSTVAAGLESIEQEIRSNSSSISDAAESDALRTATLRILDLIQGPGGISTLSGQDLRLLRQMSDRAAEGILSQFLVTDTESSDERQAENISSEKWTQKGSSAEFQPTTFN